MKTPMVAQVKQLATAVQEQATASSVDNFAEFVLDHLWDPVNTIRGKSWSEEMRAKMWQNNENNIFLTPGTIFEIWWAYWPGLRLSKT